jgi:hypothetical protein
MEKACDPGVDIEKSFSSRKMHTERIRVPSPIFIWVSLGEFLLS